MSHGSNLRQAIAFEAARLMYGRAETEYFTAKRKAARRLCRQSPKPEDLPSNAEIRDLIQVFARLHEGGKRTEHLRDMRLAALHLMRQPRAFRPRLIGSVNADRRHDELAADALAKADAGWPGRLNTRRVPLVRWQEALERRPDDIMVVIEVQ